MVRALPVLLLLLLATGCRGSRSPTEPVETGPIEAAERRWTWVGFSEARCMDGSSTGIGVSLSPRSRRVLLFLEGGGACFNRHSCERMTANLDGYGEEKFRRATPGGGVFDRDDPDNPFRDWSHVYVPYCSGDVHAGSNPDGPGGRMHVGYRNLGHFLERLVPTFPDAEQVVLAGTSAGGFGAAFNYDRVQQAFGDVPVALVDDSGPMFGGGLIKPCLERAWRESWRLDDSLPADCTECRASEDGLWQLLPFLARKYPQRRLGLVTSDADAVIRSYFGFGYGADCEQLSQMPAADFQQGVASLRAQLQPFPHFRLFTPRSQKHVFLHDSPLGQTRLEGVSLTDWLRGLVEGAPGWDNVPR